MIYLDNSATTPLCGGAKEAMGEAIAHFGNPSSRHTAGREGAELVARARAALFRALDAREENWEILFTSGGTEANNLALFGSFYAKKRRAPKLIVTDSEHPCILEPCRRLEEAGCRVVRLRTAGGKIDEEQFREEMDENVFLLSLMSVNNETGAVYPVKRLFDEARAVNPQVICHTDAVQAFLKIPFTVRSCGADMITLSAHKVHGPKGCGALALSREMVKRKALLPQIVGGGQQGGLRSGTENTVGIAGFGGAVREKYPLFASDAEKMEDLRAYLIAALPREIAVNDPPAHAPHIVSLTLPDIKSETALNFLSGRGICVSAGSACASNGRHKSHVLAAYGLSERQTDSTLRVSLSAENEKSDLDALAGALTEALETLVRFR